MPSFSSSTRGLVRAWRSVGRYSVRKPVRSAPQCPLAAMRVCSSPSRRRCLPLVLLLPNQAENLRSCSCQETALMRSAPDLGGVGYNSRP